MIARRTLLALPSALLVAGATGAVPGGMLRWDGGFLMLRVLVNGRPADGLLQLSARTTLIDRAHAAALGVTTGKGVVIEAAGKRLGPLDTTLANLTDYANFTLRGRIGLVLGRDLFGAAPFLLDLNAPAIASLPARGGRSGRALPLTERWGAETIPVTIDGMSAQAALDFRDQEPMRISSTLAGRLSLHRSRGAGSGGALMRRDAGIGKLEIAGRTFTDIRAALDDAPDAPDVTLCVPVLRHFRLGVDLPAHTLWLDPV